MSRMRAQVTIVGRQEGSLPAEVLVVLEGEPSGVGVWISVGTIRVLVSGPDLETAAKTINDVRR